MVPSSLQAFTVDAQFAGFVLLEQVECDAVEHGVVLCGVASTFAIQVLAEADVEHSVQFVFDAPVLTDGAVQPRRIGIEAGNVVSGLALGFARRLVVALGLNSHQAP